MAHSTIEIGNEIRAKRKGKNLKAYDLAKELGVSAPYITQIEVFGKMPSPVIFRKLYDYLGLSVDSLNGYIQSRVDGLGFEVCVKG